MAQPFIGEVRTFACGVVPSGWAQCNGQTLLISQNQALYAVLGITYGGDGVQTFKLPNLQGRVPVHQGNSTTGTNYPLGQSAGSASIGLTVDQTPVHLHFASGSTGAASSNVANSAVLPGILSTDGNAYLTGIGEMSTMGAGTIAQAGSSSPHENRQPFLALNICIALTGVYPVRG